MSEAQFALLEKRLERGGPWRVRVPCQSVEELSRVHLWADVRECYHATHTDYFDAVVRSRCVYYMQPRFSVVVSSFPVRRTSEGDPSCVPSERCSSLTRLRELQLQCHGAYWRRWYYAVRVAVIRHLLPDLVPVVTDWLQHSLVCTA